MKDMTTRTLPIMASDDEVKSLVVEWSELIARKQFRAALDMLPHFDKWVAWTPEALEETIAGYGSPDPHPDGVRFEVASLRERLDSADIIDNCIKVNRRHLYGLDPASYLGMVHYDDVPVSGYPEDPLTSHRSDMTARFHIKKVGSDRLTLEFLDIHVM